MGELWQASQVLCMSPEWKIQNPLLPFVTMKGWSNSLQLEPVCKFPIWPGQVLCVNYVLMYLCRSVSTARTLCRSLGICLPVNR